MGRRSARTLASLALALAFAALPSVVLAHPLGNFTINHYAGLTVRPSQVDLDVVIDMAEIPAFQERQRMDGDGDGEVTDEEIAARGAGRLRGHGRCDRTHGRRPGGRPRPRPAPR